MGVRIAAAVALAVLLGAPVAAETGQASMWASVPETGQLNFKVTRGGDPIGTHRLRFVRDGDRLIIDKAIDLEVKLAFITVFRYRHRNREVWQDDRLIAFESTTDDDGKDMAVTVTAAGEGLSVRGTKYSGPVDAEIMPSTYWNRDTVTRERILNTQNGEITDVTITPMGTERIRAMGREIEAERFKLVGTVPVDLWYAGDLWVKLAFEARGARVEYELLPPAGFEALPESAQRN